MHRSGVRQSVCFVVNVAAAAGTMRGYCVGKKR